MATPASTPAAGRKGLFAPIETVEYARKVTRDARNCFYALAAVQAVVAVFVQQFALLVDVPIYLLLGYSVSRTMSRGSAIALACFAGFVLTLSILAKAGMYQGAGGSNVVLGIIAAYYGIRAVQGTFRYHHMVQTRVVRRAVAVLSVLAFVLSIIVIVLTLVAFASLGYDLFEPAHEALLGGLVMGVPVLVTLLVFSRVIPFSGGLHVVSSPPHEAGHQR